jgi:hypothetical protein
LQNFRENLATERCILSIPMATKLDHRKKIKNSPKTKEIKNKIY